MKGNIATGDSTVAARARAAGLPILGQTHTGPWTSDDTCPQTANPWKRSKAVGGSSGGSAAACASRLAVFSVGSDTANSVRNPSANTGMSTIKPTYGLIPLHGVTPLTVSNDHAGPICRSMSDVGILLNLLAGPDSLDPRSLQAPPRPDSYPIAPRPGKKPFDGLRIGSTIETETNPAPSTWSPGIRDRLRAAVEQFRALGATIVPITPPVSDLGNTTYYKASKADPFTGNAEGAVRTRFRRTAPIGGVAGKDQLIQRAAAFTPEDLFGAYRVRREHCEKWARIFADHRHPGRHEHPRAARRRRARPADRHRLPGALPLPPRPSHGAVTWPIRPVRACAPSTRSSTRPASRSRSSRASTARRPTRRRTRRSPSR